jgi:hypothetical protein
MFRYFVLRRGDRRADGSGAFRERAIPLPAEFLECCDRVGLSVLPHPAHRPPQLPTAFLLLAKGDSAIACRALYGRACHGAIIPHR